MCSLFPSAILFDIFYSTVAGVVPCGGRKKSPRNHPSAGYFISFGIIEPILVNLKIEQLKLALWGVCSVANNSIAYEETQSNQVSDFRDFVCSLFPKAILFTFISHTKSHKIQVLIGLVAEFF